MTVAGDRIDREIYKEGKKINKTRQIVLIMITFCTLENKVIKQFLFYCPSSGHLACTSLNP